jgi:hypothetical protein
MCLIVGIIILLVVIIVPSGMLQFVKKWRNRSLTHRSHSYEIITPSYQVPRYIAHINCKDERRCTAIRGERMAMGSAVRSDTRLWRIHGCGELGATDWILSCLSLHAGGQLAPTGFTLDHVHRNHSTLRRYLKSLVPGTAVRRIMEFFF